MTSKAQRLAAAIGGPLTNKIGAVAVSAASTSEQDLTGGGALPFGAYDVTCDVACVFIQGATGMAAPVVATVGLPGTSTAIGMGLGAGQTKRIVVTSAADSFVRVIAGGAGTFRWYCATQNQPST